MEPFLEYPIERPLALEPCLDGNIKDGAVAVQQQIAGIVEPCLIQIPLKFIWKVPEKTRDKEDWLIPRSCAIFGRVSSSV